MKSLHIVHHLLSSISLWGMKTMTTWAVIRWGSSSMIPCLLNIECSRVWGNSRWAWAFQFFLHEKYHMLRGILDRVWHYVRCPLVLHSCTAAVEFHLIVSLGHVATVDWVANSHCNTSLRVLSFFWENWICSKSWLITLSVLQLGVWSLKLS